MNATHFKIGSEEGSAPLVEVAALIRGDGVDLVTRRPGYHATTVQLTCDEAAEVCAALLKAVAESEVL